MLELKKELEEHNEFSKDKIIESKSEISTNNPKKKKLIKLPKTIIY